MNINLQLKLMSKATLTEIIIMKLEDQGHQKENLIVYLLELSLMQQTLIHRHINRLTKQQTEQKTKESLIDNFSKGLLELEFKQHDQILTKYLKWIVKYISPGYKK